jgi:outer membrane usher protein
MGNRSGRGARLAMVLAALIALGVAAAYADELRQLVKSSAAPAPAPARATRNPKRQASAPAAPPGPEAAARAKPERGRRSRGTLVQAPPATTDDDPPLRDSAAGARAPAGGQAPAPGARQASPGARRRTGGKAAAPVPPAAAAARKAPGLGAPALLPLPPDGRPGDQRAILNLSVNLVDHGEVFVVLRGGDILIPVAALEGVGIRDMVGDREVFAGQMHVSLRSLAARGLAFRFDDRALTLELTAPAAGLGSTVIDLGPRRPDGIITGQTGSAFLNYAFQLRNHDVSAVSEMGASLGDLLLYSQLNITPAGRPVRGLSSLSYADRTRMRRYILGDTLAQSGLLGSAIFMGGASIVRDFTLDPYFFRFPSAGLSGVAATPSTVDVYVNGMLVHREDVAPGSFQVNNLPLPVGGSDARVVVRDAYGREQVIAAPFYFSTGTLRQGLSDYGFHVGFRRNNFATESFDYAPPVFLGRYRLGLSNWLTAGVRGEGTDQLASGGPTVTMRTLLGEIEAAAAVSRQGANGVAGSLAYTYISPAGSLGALVRGFSDRFSNLTLTPATDRPNVEGNLYAGASVGTRVALTGKVGLAHYRDAGNWQQLGLIGSVQASRGVNLFLTANRTVAQNQPHAIYDAFLTVSWALPDRVTASAFVARDNGTTSAGAEADRPLPLGSGYGYRVRVATVGGTGDFSADGMGQTDFGRYEAGYERFGQSDTVTASAAGGVVALGGRVYATRPVQASYGLIRVPGVAGVRGYLNNQEVGRTDARGDLLVPQLVPNYGNRLSIADEDLPIDYRVGGREMLLAPPDRGGAIASFDISRVRTVTGGVVMDMAGTLVVPAYGQITVRVGLTDVVSPLGRGGEFYFENLAPGRYSATVEGEAGTCPVEIDVPTDGTAFVDAGRLHCTGVAPGPTPPAVQPLPKGAR